MLSDNVQALVSALNASGQMADELLEADESLPEANVERWNALIKTWETLARYLHSYENLSAGDLAAMDVKCPKR